MSDESKISRSPENYEPIKINFKLFEKYVEKHGLEKAKGYFDALRDMTNNIEGLFYQHEDDKYYMNNSAQRVFTRTKKFKEHSFSIVDEINSSGILKDKGRDSPVPNN